MLGFGFLIAFDEPPSTSARRGGSSPSRRRSWRRRSSCASSRRRSGRSTLGCGRPRRCSAPRPPRTWREVDLPLAGARLCGRRGLRLRDRARRVRRDGLRRARRAADAARRDLPLPRPARRREPGHRGRARRRARRASPSPPRSRPSALRGGRGREGSVTPAVLDRGVPGSRSAATRARRRRPRRRRRATTVAVLGPSGSGKSTLLRAIAGLQRARRRVDRARRPRTRRECRRTGAGSASCSRTTRCSPIATWPRTSPSGCACRALPRRERGRAGRRAARPRRPRGPRARGRRAPCRAASGSGSRSRGRSRRRPRVLLLDEPLGALDRAAARSSRRGAGRAVRAIGQTAVYVTHDVAEAFALGTLVAVMREGRSSSPRPPSSSGPTRQDAWVARFIGIANVEEHGGDARRDASRGRHAPARPDRRRGRRRGRRDGPVVTLRARYDDGRTIVSTHAGLRPPSVGTRVSVEVDRAAVTEIAGEGRARDPEPPLGAGRSDELTARPPVTLRRRRPTRRARRPRRRDRARVSSSSSSRSTMSSASSQPSLTASSLRRRVSRCCLDQRTLQPSVHRCRRDRPNGRRGTIASARGRTPGRRHPRAGRRAR